MDCDQINAMLAQQRAAKTVLEAQVQVDTVRQALATVKLNDAQQEHTAATQTLMMHQQQLAMTAQTIEMLSMMHAAKMCN